MTDYETQVNRNREALQALAESDLRSAKYAQALLEAVEGEAPTPTENPFQTDTESSNDTQDKKESLFAY